LDIEVDRNGGPERAPSWSIRSKIIALVVLAALLPTFLVGTSSYWTARRVLSERLSEQLNTRASLAAARVAEWLRERRHDAVVFSSSSTVVGNLEGGAGEPPRIRAYLEEVRGRYSVYSLLAVLDSRRRLVAAACDSPDEDLSYLRDRRGNERASVEWNAAGEARFWIENPILGAEGDRVGFFLVAADFDSLRQELAEHSAAERLHLTAGGRVVLTHPEPDSTGGVPELVPGEGTLTEYRDSNGAAVLAAAGAVEEPDVAPMVLVVATDRNVAFAKVTELGRSIVLLSILVAVVVIALAYGLVVSLTDPLEKLTTGARALAKGDYSVELPVRTRDEIGDLTRLFNQMTSALKRSHDGLEQLSVTDELTKLGNRRQFQKALEEELARAEETGSGFAVVFADLDHFKRYNDRLGHLRGDALLERVGAYLLHAIEPPAVAARYGGEEFVLILPNFGVEAAAALADWIRTGFYTTCGQSEGVTLSLGVAAWPQNGRSPLELIDAADRALYDAKNRGRNRVVVAEPKNRGEAEPAAVGISARGDGESRPQSSPGSPLETTPRGARSR
jgi:diguanylate cyclase (GGDEF)-like protein